MGCVPLTPNFMILHDLGGENVGTTPLCALLSIQLDSGMFSRVFNIIPIVFGLGLMFLYGFSIVVGRFGGV